MHWRVCVTSAHWTIWKRTPILIAGLPLYHLSQIFDDVRTLAEYHAGEIQLESLKLLPGTEMRRRAEELGICYSPLPPLRSAPDP